jgi:hypothetical protein
VPYYQTQWIKDEEGDLMSLVEAEAVEEVAVESAQLHLVEDHCSWSAQLQLLHVDRAHRQNVFQEEKVGIREIEVDSDLEVFLEQNQS